MTTLSPDRRDAAKPVALGPDGSWRTSPDAGSLGAWSGPMRAGRSVGYPRQVWRRFARNRVALAALWVLLGIVLFVAAADLIAAATGFPQDEGNLRASLLPPLSGGHLLGTDVNGRDLLVRLAYGGRTSLLVAGLASLTTLGIGALVGAVAGYFGGWLDGILMRLVDVLLCLPGLSVLILVSVLYQPGKYGLALLLAALGWTGIARLVRAEVLSLRSRDFVEAARIGGAGHARVILRHILPNVVPTMIVWTSLAIPGLILTEAALSFLGFGVKIPTASWGNMLEQAKNFYTDSWTNVFIPGFAIYVTVLTINLIGNGLRDAVDPRLSEE